MLHIHPMCEIFYLPSIDTDTRGRQFKVSYERYPAWILLMKVHGKFWVLHPGIELMATGPPAQQVSVFTTDVRYVVYITCRQILKDNRGKTHGARHVGWIISGHWQVIRLFLHRTRSQECREQQIRTDQNPR